MSVTEVNKALPKAQEGHLCIHYSQLLTLSSLVLPQVTDGSAGNMGIKISWRLGDSYGWLHLCYVGLSLPHNTYSDFGPYTLHMAKTMAWAGVWCGCTLSHVLEEGLKSSCQTNTAGIADTRSCLWSFLMEHRISKDAIQMILGVHYQQALPAPLPPNILKYIPWLSHPTCHDNAANLPAAVAAPRPAKEGTDPSWRRGKSFHTGDL